MELCEKWGRAADFLNIQAYPHCDIFKGGVEFEAPLSLGCALQSHLRTNTRMLLRLKKFSAPTEKELQAALKVIPFKDFFPKNSFFDFKFTSKSSKLSMQKQILKNLEVVLKPLGVKYKKGGTTLFIRIFRDECNISLDCSGEAAFKRGEGRMGSIASLRASTANALLRVLFQGLQGPAELIDPMCGSGTFLIEALAMGRAHERKFSIEESPLFKKNADGIKELMQQMNLDQSKVSKVVGFDISEKAIQIAKTNLKSFDSDLYQVKKEDLFKGSYEPPSEHTKRVVVLNPPWGQRLPGATEDVLKAVYEKYQPHRIGFLMPARWKFSKIPLEKTRDLAILNSGVENRFLVFA